RILSSLQELEKRCGPKNGDPGVALVYFAGHAAGTAGSDPDFRKANRSQSREFLVPYDARLSATYLLPGGGSENTTFLKKEEFAAQLARLKEANIAVVLDSCHSGMPDFRGLLQLYTAQGPQSSGGESRHIGLLAASGELQE